MSNTPLSKRVKLQPGKNWKDEDRNEFNFLEKHNNPPKGYIPYYNENNVGPSKIPNINKDHIPITLSEKILLEKYGIDVKTYKSTVHTKFFTLEKNVPFKRYYIVSNKKNIKRLNQLYDRYKDEKFSNILSRSGKYLYSTEDIVNVNSEVFLPSVILDEEIIHLLKLAGYKIEVNLQLYIKNKNGKLVRLGKAISSILRPETLKLIQQKAPHLTIDKIKEIVKSALKEFQETPRKNNWRLVVSADPSDLYTMSSGRGWGSCTRVGGERTQDVDCAINANDMIAYAVSPNTKNWLIRVWLRSDGKGGWWPEGKTYGVGSILEKDFMSVVTKWLKDRGIYGTSGDFSNKAEGYSDYKMGPIPNENKNDPEVAVRITWNPDIILMPLDVERTFTHIGSKYKIISYWKNQIIALVPKSYIPGILNVNNIKDVKIIDLSKQNFIKYKISKLDNSLFSKDDFHYLVAVSLESKGIPHIIEEQKSEYIILSVPANINIFSICKKNNLKAVKIEQQADDIPLSKRTLQPGKNWENFSQFSFLNNHKKPPMGYRLAKNLIENVADKNGNIIITDEEAKILKSVAGKLNFNYVIGKGTNSDYSEYNFLPQQIIFTKNGKRINVYYKNFLKMIQKLSNGTYKVPERLLRPIKNNYRYTVLDYKDPLINYKYILHIIQNFFHYTNISDNIIPDYVIDKNNRKIRFGKFIMQAVRKHKEIVEYLQNLDIKIDNSGLVKILHGILDLHQNKSPDISEPHKLKLIISSEASDLYNMTTGRNWKSCYDEEGGMVSCLPELMNTKDMIAYLVDPFYSTWVARLWLRYDGEGGWWPEGTVYYDKNESINKKDFTNTVVNWLKSKNIYGKVGKYQKESEQQWSDYLGGIVEKERDNEVFEHDPYSKWDEFEDKRNKNIFNATDKISTYKINVKNSFQIDFDMLDKEFNGRFYDKSINKILLSLLDNYLIIRFLEKDLNYVNGLKWVSSVEKIKDIIFHSYLIKNNPLENRRKIIDEILSKNNIPYNREIIYYSLKTSLDGYNLVKEYIEKEIPNITQV